MTGLGLQCNKRCPQLFFLKDALTLNALFTEQSVKYLPFYSHA